MLSSTHLDINGGRDIAWSVRRSNVLTAGGNPTWIICGQSTTVNNILSDCIVARVDVNGVVIWCKRYNFPVNGNPSFCIAKQLCEDAGNNIYIVGTQRATNVVKNNGLVFKVGPGGALIWAKSYHIDLDIKLEAVRFINAGAGIAVGGQISNGVMSNMLLLQIMPNGALGFRNILKAQDAAGNLYPSQCFDLVQIPGGSFFLAGYLIKNGANVQMMYKVAAGGAGINWYKYNRMESKEGFGLDYVDEAGIPGIALFSSMRNPVNPPQISDSHIMKTDLSGNVCIDFCDPQPPTTLQIGLETVDPSCNPLNAGTGGNLNNLVRFYDNFLICTGLCHAAAIAASINKSQVQASPETNGNIKISPNPVSGLLHVHFNSLPVGEYQVTILNMQGEAVLQKNGVFNNGSSDTDLDISSVASGIYMLTVRKDKLVLQQKIVKQ